MRSVLVSLGLSLLIAACEQKPEAPPAIASTTAAPSASIARWSGRAEAPGATSVDDAGPTKPDPIALEELLAAAPKEPPKPTGDEGRTAVGTPTGETDAGASDAGSTGNGGHKGGVEVGEMQIQPSMSSPSVERAGRQQLYWNLVTRCRDKGGEILPPDAVKLEFLIDPDGYITASSIVASAADPRFESAARCMRRELSAATFRAPASGRGMTTHVTATVPSVD